MQCRYIVAVIFCVAAAALAAGSAPALAAEPVHLQGGDSVEATQQVLDGFATGLTALKYQLLDPLYAKDLVYEDFTFLVHADWRPYIMWNLRRSLQQTDSVRVLATHADRGWGVVEHTWDMSTVNALWLQPLTLLGVRDGHIVYEGWYFANPFAFSDGRPPQPTPLATAPGPGDTAAAAEAVALRYAAALQAKDAGTMAALSAPKIAFLDTASGSVAGNPGQVQAACVAMFREPTDLAFENLRYVCGPGWAAVFWTARPELFPLSGEGATMLEIRDGRIARETLYYAPENMPFGG